MNVNSGEVRCFGLRKLENMARKLGLMRSEKTKDVQANVRLLKKELENIGRRWNDVKVLGLN
jgi:hypothetical protein